MPELEITKSNMSEYTRNTTAATPKTMISTNNNNYTNQINLMFMPVTQPISKKPSVKILIDEYNLNKNKDTAGEKNVILGTVQNKLNLAHGIQEAKFQYRVNPYTAPPWVWQDHGKGEPSENSFNYESRAKLQMKECDIRKWNKDLKAINANLDLWHVWLQTACKNIIWLKKYSEMNKLCSPGIIKENTRNWVNLKKDMDKDIIIWPTLNKQTQKRLKTYKTTYEKYGKQILSVEQNVLKCSCKKRRM
ncbi:uncharacterized protein LOC131845816 [Achroia grisella]|uniref:uncharacterized protein LOC131845816 n=1 Tax=Achroia grisella TaxID=688607 RepID=UPI0027D1ED78|nr:uncharacterized protein LOC131845816 [Achroia grisella]XP_059050925.1 uncharacterized protein LOC131845816 [Achroia grisella]